MKRRGNSSLREAKPKQEIFFPSEVTENQAGTAPRDLQVGAHLPKDLLHLLLQVSNYPGLGRGPSVH